MVKLKLKLFAVEMRHGVLLAHWPAALHQVQTRNPKTKTLHLEPCTLNPTPYTLTPTPHTPNLEPYALNSTP